MINDKNVPLNEIGIQGSAAKVSPPIFITTHPADQKAGDHEQTDKVHTDDRRQDLQAHR
ncbi:hypothetical protein HFN72_02960 [Rhizobium laguerreae]|uniref:hypothetical protein n=1 Tax=Rhizobium laguerreae TaxID=1076926 RepID=UPI001C8FBB79|nr:hypothetical protein [Rhizobium laguerreae]MBY3524945.1 hypothetical protein [Rhizobium laguerreae]